MLTLKLGFHYWKPVQTGSALGTDSDFVRQYLNPDRVLKEIYCLKQPTAPAQAAHDEGVEIKLTEIIRQRPLCDTIIEGAGGVLVPLNEREHLIDLISHLGSPVILVARSTLGTINHTLLSLEALRARSLTQIAVIMVGPKNIENRIAIEKHGNISVIGEIPELEELTRQSLIDACKFIRMEETGWINSMNS